MQRLPANIEAAIQDLRHGSGSDANRLRTSHQALAAAYRDGHSHPNTDKSGEDARLAYLAARMPATYAAIAECLAQAARVAPVSGPKSVLDIGAGPGTASLAAANAFPQLARVTQVDADPSWQPITRQLGKASDHPCLADPDWLTGPVSSLSLPAHDWVLAAYVLDEIPDRVLPGTIEKLWHATAQILLLVCAGTPHGFARILAARQHVLAMGANILAPCTHASPCPMRDPDWCHRPVRLARTRAQQDIKLGHRSYEDEKFSYLILSRHPAVAIPQARIVMRPRAAKGHVRLTLCSSNGLAGTVISARDGRLYREARDAQWGGGWDTLPSDDRSR